MKAKQHFGMGILSSPLPTRKTSRNGTRRTKRKSVNKSRHVRKFSFGTAIRQAVRKELLKVGRKNVS